MSLDKFSVIIPTMWYSYKTERLLYDLDSCDNIGEIILIDNNSTMSPKYLQEIRKLIYLPQKENIYVNPSWNLGVSLSKYSHICICNDDINFNIDIFNFIKPKLYEGVYGMFTGNYYRKDIHLNYEVEKIIKRPWGWGCLLFIHKKNWIDIDSRLKIACGDDFLLKFVKGGGYQIKHLDLEDSNVSTTSIKSVFFEQQKKDIEVWSLYLH